MNIKCLEPQKCSNCGAPNGPVQKHKPTASPTCTQAQYCQLCNEILQNALDHLMVPATCVTPSKCTRDGCNHTEGFPAPHIYGDWVNEDNHRAGEDFHWRYRICNNCKNQKDWDKAYKLEGCEECYPSIPGTGSGEDKTILGSPTIISPASMVQYNTDVIVQWAAGENATYGKTEYIISIMSEGNYDRFNCGTGLSYVIPANKISLGKFYTVTVTATESGKTDSPPSSSVTFTVIQGTGIDLELKGAKSELIYTTQVMLIYGNGTTNWWINSNGTPSTSSATAYFGDGTEASIAKFQEYCVTNGLMTNNDFEPGHLNQKTFDTLIAVTSEGSSAVGVCQLHKTSTTNCGCKFTKLSNPPGSYGYADIWRYCYTSTIFNDVKALFKDLGFRTESSDSTVDQFEYERTMMSSNIIVFQYNMGYTVTGRLTDTLKSQLQAAKDNHETYTQIITYERGGDLGSRPNYAKVGWTSDDYEASGEIVQGTTQTIADQRVPANLLSINGIGSYTIVPSARANMSRVPGGTSWTAVDKYIAVKWANIVQDASAATKKKKDGTNVLVNGNTVPLNISRFNVSAFDSGFRTFVSQEYFWHLYQVSHSDYSGALASTPGNSPHGVGYAIDFILGGGTMNTIMPDDDYEGIWMAANKDTYGVNGLDYNPTSGVYKEPWHWNFD